ncbi:hypothetical protein CHS0354_000745 [Potamilus streckersoni]|uniref:Uncharacterized protein n=1 Tax=Potamilus streckersoni TaxID=2493646 RepID=A0AAE0T7A0_9BIVA|nr:hypothetical protein CHS0354_000745 [Potamilus streckersoni]
MHTENDFADFTNQYSLEKTLKFGLIPVNEKLEIDSSVKPELFRKSEKEASLLEKDTERGNKVEKMKLLIREYDKWVIEEKLKVFEFVIQKQNGEINYKTAENVAVQFNDLAFAKPKNKQLDLFKKIEAFFNDIKHQDLLPEIEGKVDIINEMKQFPNYFKRLDINRQTIFQGVLKNSIAFRIVEENLPKFKENLEKYQSLPIELKNDQWNNVTHSSYNKVLTQSGISKYNEALGKLNSSINEWCQNNSKQNQLPQYLMMPLFKQILSDKEKNEFDVEFKDDKTLLETIQKFYSEGKIENAIKDLFSIFPSDERLKSIYISQKELGKLSNYFFDKWDVIKSDNEFVALSDVEAMIQAKDKSKSILNYYQAFSRRSFNKETKTRVDKNLFVEIGEALKRVETFWAQTELNLRRNKEQKIAIQDYLQTLMHLLYFIKPLILEKKREPVKVENKDFEFYSKLEPIYNELKNIIPLFNAARNYLTQKPYSTDKIKINFECGQLLDGWSVSAESSKLSIILRKDGMYYLGILNKQGFLEKDYDKYGNLTTISIDSKNQSKETFEKMTYWQKQSGLNANVPLDFVQYLKQGKVFSNFYEGEIPIQDLSNGYVLRFDKINAGLILNLVKEQKLFLFKIHNKDFSKNSKGAKNLHTLYWHALFDFTNNPKGNIKLNGGGEIFFRKASVKKDIIHEANKAILNKNPLNEKRESTFTYELIKDKRFTEDKWEFHISITINKHSKGIKPSNEKIRSAFENIIGIDLGERNLVYYSVIDQNGKILDQGSLNVIESGKQIVDYHSNLTKREKARDKARKQWGEIVDIKNLKEGYLSQVVHKICQLIVKYNAVIVMEDLSVSFQRSRMIYERQVYQKLQKMLIDKLNYLVSKKREGIAVGSIFNGIQLTHKYDAAKFSREKQNGIVFLVDPSYTSKICPLTGFHVDLSNLKTKKADYSKLFNEIKSVKYNATNHYFEFQYKNEDRIWTVCSVGKGRWYWDSKNKKVESFEDATQCLKSLFIKNEIKFENEQDLKTILGLKKDPDFIDTYQKLVKVIFQLRHTNKETGEDFILSPVADKEGVFFDSREEMKKGKDEKGKWKSTLPVDGDANEAPQIEGKAAHEAIDNKRYSTRKNVLMGIEVYSERYHVAGKIDIYDGDKRLLTERKKRLEKIYDGQVFQLYAQYHAMVEMGYEVEALRLYSMSTNKNFAIPLPKDDPSMQEKFEATLLQMRSYRFFDPFVPNKAKCDRCIYNPLCDMSLADV